MVDIPSPALILVAGLPASGKTWFARALAACLGVLHLNSDLVRAELGLRGQYDAPAKQQVYQAMFEKGKAALEERRAVVVDATFYKESLWRPWLELAARCDAFCFLIEITTPEAVALERLTHPRPDSEADQQVYLKLKAAWEPLTRKHLTLDSTAHTTEEMVEAALVYLQSSENATTG